MEKAGEVFCLSRKCRDRLSLIKGWLNWLGSSRNRKRLLLVLHKECPEAVCVCVCSQVFHVKMGGLVSCKNMQPPLNCPADQMPASHAELLPSVPQRSLRAELMMSDLNLQQEPESLKTQEHFTKNLGINAFLGIRNM